VKLCLDYYEEESKLDDDDDKISGDVINIKMKTKSNTEIKTEILCEDINIKCKTNNLTKDNLNCCDKCDGLIKRREIKKILKIEKLIPGEKTQVKPYDYIYDKMYMENTLKKENKILLNKSKQEIENLKEKNDKNNKELKETETKLKEKKKEKLKKEKEIESCKLNLKEKKQETEKEIKNLNVVLKEKENEIKKKKILN
jgi:hypothetical protein